MDASQYKDYVLFILFIKYITDKYGDSTDSGRSRSQGRELTDMLALRVQGELDIRCAPSRQDQHPGHRAARAGQ